MTKLLKKIVIVLGLIGLGGCMNKQKITKDEIKKTQVKIALHIVQNYDNIKRISFNSFYADDKTGYISSQVVVNDIFNVVARINGINGKVSLDMNPQSSKKLYKSTSNSMTLENIDVKYYGE